MSLNVCAAPAEKRDLIIFNDWKKRPSFCDIFLGIFSRQRHPKRSVFCDMPLGADEFVRDVRVRLFVHPKLRNLFSSHFS